MLPKRWCRFLAHNTSHPCNMLWHESTCRIENFHRLPHRSQVHHYFYLFECDRSRATGVDLQPNNRNADEVKFCSFKYAPGKQQTNESSSYHWSRYCTILSRVPTAHIIIQWRLVTGIHNPSLFWLNVPVK